MAIENKKNYQLKKRMLFKLSKKKTNGARHKLLIIKQSLIKFKPLLKSIKKTPFKSYNKHRITNLKLNPLLQTGTIVGYDKDNYKTNFLALIKFHSGAFSYFPATAGLTKMSIILFANFNKTKILSIGNITLLKYLQPGSKIHSLTAGNKHRIMYSRAAGTFVTLIMHFKDSTTYVKLPSMQLKKISNMSRCVVGQAGNIIHKFENLGKAGYKKYFGLKPQVRGVAKNAVDHPHGGRTKGGIPKHSP